MKSEFSLRILFAAVAIPLTLGIVLYGGEIFRIFLMLMLLGGGVELYFMTRERGKPLLLMPALFGIFVLCLRGYGRFEHGEAVLFPALFAVLFITVITEVLRADPDTILERAGGTLLAVFYVGFLGSFLLAITQLKLPIPAVHGYTLKGIGLVALLLSVWSSDTLAYFAGKNFGKHLLLPKASPKKTVEGLLGSMAGGALGLLAAKSFLRMDFLGSGYALFLGLLIGLFGQAGDLFESLLKRACGVKDSSKIFPGHGGILDRIDALIFCAPIYYYALLWVLL